MQIEEKLKNIFVEKLKLHQKKRWNELIKLENPVVTDLDPSLPSYWGSRRKRSYCTAVIWSKYQMSILMRTSQTLSREREKTWCLHWELQEEEETLLTCNMTNWLSDNTLIHRKNHEVAIHHGVCWTSTHQHSIHPYLTDYSPKGLDTLDHLELNTAQYTSYKSHDFGNDNEPENNFLLPINNDSQYYPFEQLNSTLATKYQLLTLTISRSLYANFHKIKDYLLGMSQ